MMNAITGGFVYGFVILIAPFYAASQQKPAKEGVIL